MRQAFFLIIKARPTPGAMNASDLNGANVNVWVMATTVKDAVTTAQSHILGYAWIPQEVRFAGEVTGELIEAVDDLETSNYQEGLRSGIAAAFYCWTKEDMSPEFYEYRYLGTLLDGGGKGIH
jgi:hypothetical protein